MGYEDRDYFEPTDRLQRRWTVNWILIAACVAVFVFEAIWHHLLFKTSNTGSFFQREFTLNSVAVVERFRDWQLLTHIFLDVGPIALLFNMLALYWFGNDLEELLGKKSYLVLFFGGAFVSAVSFVVLGYLIWPGQHFTGPGGAISSVLAVCALTWPDRRIIVYVIPMKLKWAVLLFLGLDIYYGVTQLGIASLAHLMGAVWGFVFWKFRERVADRLDAMDDRAAIRSDRRSREVALARSAEIDQILKKISESGLGSLSSSERRMLDEESRRKGMR